MTEDYLNALVNRSLNLVEMVYPRPTALFEAPHTTWRRVSEEDAEVVEAEAYDIPQISSDSPADPAVSVSAPMQPRVVPRPSVAEPVSPPAMPPVSQPQALRSQPAAEDRSVFFQWSAEPLAAQPMFRPAAAEARPIQTPPPRDAMRPIQEPPVLEPAVRSRLDAPMPPPQELVVPAHPSPMETGPHANKPVLPPLETPETVATQAAMSPVEPPSLPLGAQAIRPLVVVPPPMTDGSIATSEKAPEIQPIPPAESGAGDAVRPQVTPLLAPQPPAAEPATAPEPIPNIQVTIGRIEVRTTKPQPQVSRARGPAAPVMNLGEYLRKRSSGENV